MDTKTKIFTTTKKFLGSFNGAYNPSNENERFLQWNKNIIPLMGCTTNLEKVNNTTTIMIIIHSFNNNNHTFILRAMGCKT